METDEYLDYLHDFIVQAKAATYVGGGQEAEPCRTGSHDLIYTDGDFSYLDSYFGGEDFIGQEVVYHQVKPVWAMNYYGKILMPKKITGEQAGVVIKASLSKMYEQGRFLGGFTHSVDDFNYFDNSKGGFSAFSGREWITHETEIVYQLLYHGGLIR